MRIPPFKKTNIAAIGGGSGGGNSAVNITNCNGTSDNSVIFTPNAAFDSAIASGTWSITYWLEVSSPPADGGSMTTYVRTNETFSNDDAQYVLQSGASSAAMNGEWSTTDDSGASSTSPFTDLDVSEWSSFALLASAGEMNMYKDNVLVATAPVLDGYKVNPASYMALFFLGAVEPASPVVCDVSLADFRIYSSTLTAQEVEDLADKQDVTANLITRLKFEGNCNDSVGSMNGTKGANVTYVPGPPGLPA